MAITLPAWTPERLIFGEPTHLQWLNQMQAGLAVVEALADSKQRRKNKTYKKKPCQRVLCHVCDKAITSGQYRRSLKMAAHQRCFKFLKKHCVYAYARLQPTPTQRTLSDETNSNV